MITKLDIENNVDILNKIIYGDNLDILNFIPDNYIDMILTSPPYLDLRKYEGINYNFGKISFELNRILKPGGILVWVEGDKTENGNETDNCFEHALYFKNNIGMLRWDTMIYWRHSPFPANVRYNQEFEYMFIFTKGTPKTFNPLMQQKSNKSFKKNYASSSVRNAINGETKKYNKNAIERLEKSNNNLERIRGNIWYIPTGYMVSANDTIAFEHPAIFPEELAKDHILSWSNENDIILDCFNGSGTTTKMAKMLNRNYIGIDISENYCKIAENRLNSVEKTEEYLRYKNRNKITQFI